MKTCGEIEDKKPFERYVKKKIEQNFEINKVVFFVCASTSFVKT